LISTPAVCGVEQVNRKFWKGNKKRHVTCLLPEFSVVLDGDVPALLKLERGIDLEIFAGRLAVRLGPLGLPRVLLPLEESVALGATKLEDLSVHKPRFRLRVNKLYCNTRIPLVERNWYAVTHLAVISDESHAVPRPDWVRTEVTLFYAHVSPTKLPLQNSNKNIR
jgi:hypothetical protein